MSHAAACTAFATPTVNGYRRYRPNSLAPDRATWCHDHRGVMVRVLGAPGDPATRLENRVGEPAANPYLYIASQIAAGLDGIEHELDPGAPDDDPYTADRPLLPTSLPAALDALERDALFAATSARCSSTTTSRSSATKPAATRNGWRSITGRMATSRPNGSRTSISIFSSCRHSGARVGANPESRGARER